MKTLSDYTQEAQTALFKKTGSFFAFSTSQFNEQKVEGTKYVNAHHGLIIPQANVKEVIDGLSAIAKDGMAKDMAKNGAAVIMRREYFNHECQISMDNTPVKEALAGYIERYPSEFTEQAMDTAFSEAFLYACENDLF